MSDIFKLPPVEGLVPSVGITDSGSIFHTTLIQRGVIDFRPLKSRVIKTAGSDENLVRGLGKVNLIFNSEAEAVPVTLDDILVVCGSRCDLFKVKASDHSGKSFRANDGTVSLLDGKLEFPMSGGLDHQMAYRATPFFFCETMIALIRSAPTARSKHA